MDTKVKCRSCQGSNLKKILNLGLSPLADRLLTQQQLLEPEPKFPLELAYCQDCSLVQILETVSPDVLFGNDYPYYSSVIASLLKHSKENVLELIESRKLSTSSFVVELASNDGYLLKNYVLKKVCHVSASIPPMDRSMPPTKSAYPRCAIFLPVQLGRKLASEGKRADVIHANNVLAHVADTNGFVQGIYELLKDTGVAVIEVPYVKDLIDHCEFDTIYHQHLCYFSVTSLDNLFRRHKLYLNEIKHLDIHGGSLRLYVERIERVGTSEKPALMKRPGARSTMSHIIKPLQRKY